MTGDIYILIVISSLTWWFLAVLYQAAQYDEQPGDTDWLDELLAAQEDGITHIGPNTKETING